MNFLNLYKSNKKAVQDYLISQWCQNADNDVQKKYSEKIKQLIENELFTSDNYIPMVQCMEGYPTINAEEYKGLAGTIKNLWVKATDSQNIDTPDFYPYRHQFEAWNALNEGKSMVVTTGTGSGKTECFMMPLIADLLDNPTAGVKAIFLYPLNALMEDQKARLQKLLAGTDLKFAVYNGNLPEEEERNREELEIECDRYPNILATRQKMRREPADIILTNPTMLEYMLLRDKDQGLFNAQTLRWIVIDEAHTFSGAGAAEMAMLIRRVLYAFNRTAEDVRFAVSSATIGNDDNNQTATKRFITGLTGVAANRLSVISGNREFVASGNNEVDDYKKKLIQADFMSLNDLIEGEQSIEDKLGKLDELCESGLRAKVHFFYRIANTGIKVRLDQIDTENNLNTFKLYSTMKTEEKEEAAEITYPYLDLMRCKKCGEYIAVGQVKDHDIYESLAYSTSDIFDENERTNKVIFGIRNGDFAKDLNKRTDVVADGNVYRQAQATEQSNIVTTTRCECPYCGEELKTKSNSDKELEKKVYQFKVYAREISRILAPSILNEQQPAEGETLPCNGRQYISFVDSRKSASASTLEQNLEQERLWIFRTIFKHLNSFSEEENKRISVYRRLIEDPEMLDDERNRYDTLLKGLENKRDGKLSWGRIYDILNNSPESDRFAEIFGKKDDNGTVNEEEKRKYILAAMVDVLERRQRLAEKDGETMGLFTTYYAKLETVTELPQEVSVYFERVGKTGAEALTEWKNLLKIYLDTTVRSNQNTFFKDTKNFDNIDIMACQRFASKKPKRRSAKRLTCDNATYSNIVLLLAKGLAEETDSLGNVVRNNEDIISNVLTEIWNVLYKIGLLQSGETYNGQDWVQDRLEDGTNQRLNLADLGFKRYENVYMVETGKGVYRPVETLFLGYSPYIIDRNNVLKPSNEQPENWGICDLMDGNIHTRESINEWVSNYRRCMCEKNVWGEHGVFSTQINFILSGFPIFYQAEHTAQVGKKIARDSQEKFKQHLINILACSTTMEMGVDLGSLETVLMASIPPHPQNYKQRAGRSGRRGNNRSVSITLCNSDSIGLRTLTNPMDTIIKKKMQVPTVDLDCPEIVQRHVNAFLLRESGQLSRDRDDNNLDMELIEFFTNYHFKQQPRGNREWEVKKGITGTQDIQTVVPSDGLGDLGVRYTRYLDYLTSNTTDLYNGVECILRGTNYDAAKAVEKANDSIKALFERLSDYFDRISAAYRVAAENGRRDDGYVTTPPGPKLRLAFNAKLAENLITYFATNRYTPNANMPVDIIQFQRKVNNNNFSMKKPDNPSYPLRTALSQYSPGLSVVVNNKSYIVRGVRYTDIYNETQSFLTLYQVGDEVKDHITEYDTNLSRWKVSDRKELTLVQPTAFVTDQNESASRCVEQPYFPQCGAMLVGATDQESTNNGFISYRTSDSTNNSKVLYYNMGMGYGFCYCRTCGKAVPEVGPNQRALPAEMQGHKRIDGGGDCGNANPMRNVIFGNLIQTDYCEFSLFDEEGIQITKRNENIPLLTTLGILFSRMFAEYINKDSNDIDFMILPNGRLCIFDVNPGGSGYSNRLPEYLDDVIDKIENVLNNAHSVDDILDKYSIRFINDVNLEVAKKWIKAYREGLNTLPGIYPDAIAIASHRENLKHKIKTSDGEPIVFVNNDYDKWDDMEMCDFRNAVFAFRKGENDHVPFTLSVPLTRISGKYRCVKTFDFSIGDGLYPLAIVDGFLYFTTEKDYSNANSYWARGKVYKVKYENNLETQDYENTTPENCSVIHLAERYQQISSNDLYGLVSNTDGARTLFDEFYRHCKANKDKNINVTYTDKYINSALAVVTALQFIYKVLGKINNERSIEINTIFSKPNNNIEILNGFEDEENLRKYLKKIMKNESKINIMAGRYLPHYRELKLTCAGKTLVISPDGGFLNGWYLDTRRAEYEGIVYTVEDLTLDDNNIYLYQTSHDIKYTLELQDEN